MGIIPYYNRNGITLYLGDCRKLLHLIDTNMVTFVLTDPPYPDQHPEYGDCDIAFLADYTCRQLVFWSAKVAFPLDYTAIHIWDKLTGVASEYERIFERNGQHNFKVFRSYLVNSRVAGGYYGDNFYGHPSQKPLRLISKLIADFTKPNDIILDPFLGTGTTAVCAYKLGRKCIGIELRQDYLNISIKRLQQTAMVLES